MSLGIIFKGPEGIVFAADSRVTLNYTIPNQNVVIPAFYDNATKLLKFNHHPYVGVVTYGVGAIGLAEPRTAHSFLPEFETELGDGRISVADFAEKLGKFFLDQWKKAMPAGVTEDMVFLVAGYNENEPYGRVYQVMVPNAVVPVEQNGGQFGLTFGGQSQLTARILNCFDELTIGHVQTKLKVSPADMLAACKEAAALYGTKIPYQFLPLQDCIDLAILLVTTTAQIMQYVTDVRGVGGAVDVAVITRTKGFTDVQAKQIRGQRFVD
jgi:hypothetical protein